MELMNIPVWWHFMYNQTEYTRPEIAKVLQKSLSEGVLHTMVNHRQRTFDRSYRLEMNDGVHIEVLYMTDEKGLSFNAIVLYAKAVEE